MRLGSIYFHVLDMKTEANFWVSLLGMRPSIESEGWCEFSLGGARIGLLLDEDSTIPVNSSAVLELEIGDREIDGYIEKAQAAGGYIVVQGLSSRIIMATPSGHKFELKIAKAPPSAA